MVGALHLTPGKALQEELWINSAPETAPYLALLCLGVSKTKDRILKSAMGSLQVKGWAPTGSPIASLGEGSPELSQRSTKLESEGFLLDKRILRKPYFCELSGCGFPANTITASHPDFSTVQLPVVALGEERTTHPFPIAFVFFTTHICFQMYF